MADPVIQQKRLDAMRAAMSTPEHSANKRAARLKLEMDRRDDPAWIAHKIRNGKRLYAAFMARPDAEDIRKARQAVAARKTQEKNMAWCPEHFRADYQKLRRKVGAPEARRVILADLAAKERARLASMSGLDRQLERLNNGCRLIEKPTFDKPAYTFTLGGISTGMFG